MIFFATYYEKKIGIAPISPQKDSFLNKYEFVQMYKFLANSMFYLPNL
jgi:hypothetical protein